MASAFTYDNRNPRAPNPLTLTLRRVVPGVGAVAEQTAPYAAWWRERNLEALATEGPLWAVLGDSMSQGIGASAVGRSLRRELVRRYETLLDAVPAGVAADRFHPDDAAYARLARTFAGPVARTLTRAR